MHYALVDSERTAPLPGLKGSCPICASLMIPKCGSQRMHHWAHRGERVCDSWWEPETPWHRYWKNSFPIDWQEVIRPELSGEKHIADVHTPHGLTLEIQHSHLRPEERLAREKGHGNMIWVVDGSRLLRDLPRFLEGSRNFWQTPRGGVFVTARPEEAFPLNWINCTAPVLFDFDNAPDPTGETAHIRDPIWCLLPGRVFGHVVILRVSRTDFVRWVQQRAQPIPVQAVLREVAQWIVEQTRRSEVARSQAAMLLRNRRRRKRGRMF